MADRPTHLDLCSGIGGFSLAAQWAGFKTIGFSEINPYCCKVLAKQFLGVSNYGDIRTLDGRTIGPVDLITAGFPCQPFSLAGKQAGQDDERHLWPEVHRVIAEIGPTFFLGENVPGLIGLALERVCLDLESLGFEVQPLVIPACAVNAPHRRDRVWIVAHAEQCGRRQRGNTQGNGHAQEAAVVCPTRVAADDTSNGRGSGRRAAPAHHASQPLGLAGQSRLNGSLGTALADAAQPGQPQHQGRLSRAEQAGGNQFTANDWRLTQPHVCRISHELSEGLDRPGGHGGLTNGQTEKTRAGKVLRGLPQEIGAQAVCEQSGRPDAFYEPEALRRDLHGQSDDEGRAGTFSPAQARVETPPALLSTVRRYLRAEHSPHGPGLAQQRPREFRDAVQFVSHVLASRTGTHFTHQTEAAVSRLRHAFRSSFALQYPPHPLEEVWRSLSDAEAEWLIMAACEGPFWRAWPGVDPIAPRRKDTTDRLKALGNAIVPAVAFQILRTIVETYYA